MKSLLLFAAGILLLSGCAGAPPREPAPPVSPPAATRPGAAPRPGAVVGSPSEAAGTRFIRVLLSGGTSGVV
ncbi:MAG TPA: hypothetical protein VK303_02970, partial [Desulfobacteria bacterium]|nr:hypothetical protein [Desulfobacteria bacterium]